MCGPTGSGKTWTGLEWARVLVGPTGTIAVVDTENRSASYYADRHDFDVLDWVPPYDPTALANQLKAAASDYDCILVDSLSHFWEGEGGTLDIADNASKRYGGNSYAGWKDATPQLRYLVDTLRSLDCHVIVTMRSKMEYVQNKDEKSGKTTIAKLGMAPIMRAGVEYEFTLVLDFDLQHIMTVSKSRCDVVADKVAQPGRAGEVAEMFRDWLATGTRLVSPPQAEALIGRMNELPEAARVAVKSLFVREFGKPDMIHADQFDTVMAWVQSQHDLLALAVAEPSPTAAEVHPSQQVAPAKVETAAEKVDRIRGHAEPSKKAGGPMLARLMTLFDTEQVDPTDRNSVCAGVLNRQIANWLTDLTTADVQLLEDRLVAVGIGAAEFMVIGDDISIMDIVPADDVPYDPMDDVSDNDVSDNDAFADTQA